MQASNQVTSTPTCSIENRDERDKEDAMEEDRRNLRIIRGLAVRGDIKSRIYIAHQRHFGNDEGNFSVSRLHALGYQFLEASFLFFVNETTTTTTTTTVDEERDDKDDDEYEDDDKPLFGYRDLTKTKARLMKGDEMLDRSFENFGYHLLDDPSMSELGAYVQSARNLSKNMLQEFVRPVWEPNEYPKSIQRVF